MPVNYETAKLALLECQQIDECKDWADKAEALASYFAQRDDEIVLNFLKRIKGRSIRQCGILLKEIEVKKFKGNQHTEVRDGTGPHQITREKLASEAGLSERQQKTAVRVANIPEEEFDQLIEQDKPPTLTKLAAIGTKPKPKPLVDFYAEGITEAEFKQAVRLHGFICVGACEKYC